MSAIPIPKRKQTEGGVVVCVVINEGGFCADLRVGASDVRHLSGTGKLWQKSCGLH